MQARWSGGRPAAVAMAMLCLVLAGCSGGDGGGANTPEATSVPTAAPTATPQPSLGEVIWTSSLAPDGSPGDRLERLPRTAAVIHAVLQADAFPAGATVTAAWTIDGQSIDGAGTTVTIEEATASGWVAFSLTWTGEALWPFGTLGVTVTASTGASAEGTIAIVST